MVSLGILAMGLLALLALQASALKQGRYGRHTSHAAEIAQNVMEQLQRLHYEDDARVQPMGWTDLPDVPLEVETASGTIQTQVFSVEKRIVQDPNADDMRQIDVRVTWDEPGMPENAPARRYAISSIRHHDPQEMEP